MKQLLLLLLIFPFAIGIGYGQKSPYCIINFEDYSRCYDDTLVIDKINYPNNNWEIGQPDKSVFQSALSLPNAIVTKLDTFYSTNDTSSFTIIHIADDALDFFGILTLTGYYKIDSDTLTDYGTIEFSPDNGVTWIDLLTDTFYSQQGLYRWSNPNYEKPVFSGTSSAWKIFNLRIEDINHVFNISYGDTVLFKFTFISDSIQTFKDGWMIDNIEINDWFEGIDEVNHGFRKISVYPNPFSSDAIIESDTPLRNATLIVYNTHGQRVIQRNEINGRQISIDGSNLPNGLYFIQLTEQNKTIATGKIIIQR